MDERISSIPSFFRDRSVLITGASGFIGKAVVEKLLRSCPEIKTIYLLLRPKKGHDAKQRLETILNSELFDKVKKKEPNAISKVIAIEGDIQEDGLGMNPSDEKLVTENVSVVFHSAATVRFNEPLKRAVELNVLGTRRVTELGRKMQNLEAFIHVSTAYCQSAPEIVDEVIYKFPYPAKKFIEAIEWMSEDLVDAFSPYVLREASNSYVYTKALAETYLAEECSDIPVAIVRPSIVSATWREPFPGWVDNYNACTGFLVAIGKGLLRCIHCLSTDPLHMIPVDSVANILIAVGWYTASHRRKDIMVFNFASSIMDKEPTKKILQYLVQLLSRYPSEEFIRSPNFHALPNKVTYTISKGLLHTIPAYFYDTLAVLTGQKPRFVRLMDKIHESSEGIIPFISRRWIHNSQNTSMLRDTLSPEDSKEFNFDIKSLSWKHYLEDYVLGTRKYLLKEDPATLPLARKKLQRIILYERLVQCICIAFILWLLLVIFKN